MTCIIAHKCVAYSFRAEEDDAEELKESLVAHQVVSSLAPQINMKLHSIPCNVVKRRLARTL